MKVNIRFFSNEKNEQQSMSSNKLTVSNYVRLKGITRIYIFDHFYYPKTHLQETKYQKNVYI